MSGITELEHQNKTGISGQCMTMSKSGRQADEVMEKKQERKKTKSTHLVCKYKARP